METHTLFSALDIPTLLVTVEALDWQASYSDLSVSCREESAREAILARRELVIRYSALAGRRKETNTFGRIQ